MVPALVEAALERDSQAGLTDRLGYDTPCYEAVPIRQRPAELDSLNEWSTIGSAVFGTRPGCPGGGFVQTLLTRGTHDHQLHPLSL